MTCNLFIDAIKNKDMEQLPPFVCCLRGTLGKDTFNLSTPDSTDTSQNMLQYVFLEGKIRIVKQLYFQDGALLENITLHNDSEMPLHLEGMEAGWEIPYDEYKDSVLSAVPFLVQQDGWRHEYPLPQLQTGSYHHIVNADFPKSINAYGNSVYSDHSRPEPPLIDFDLLRSEGWALHNGEHGVLFIKHNETAVEYSLVKPCDDTLLIGATGLCLYGEPDRARDIEPGGCYTFGTTYCIPYTGDANTPSYLYRAFLDKNGHALPKNYNPPVHWNELYDIGWHHSRRSDLLEYYSFEALCREAEKAVACKAEQLYLDPGWEFAEGLTFWDNQRLGDLADFIKYMREKYNLGVALRTIVRTYLDYWPRSYITKRTPDDLQLAQMVPPTVITSHQLMWEICASNSPYIKEKLKRIDFLASQGISFFMFDESDWRGACYEESHGHEHTPSRAAEHMDAVLDLSKYVHDKYPDILCEVHDPVWPWNSCRYVQTYYRQGWGETGSYHENWGFEFMWDCINDLKSGKALSTYYYNLGCNIPLYLHINMGADNDNCIFFWWAASTIRHLGLGGKTNHKTVEPPNKLAPYDKEKRFSNYCGHMKVYRTLKPYFVRGTFIGIAENIHLHTLPDAPGGVINVFNLTETDADISFTVSANDLNGTNLEVYGADSFCWEGDTLRICAAVRAMDHRLVTVGVKP